jgi:hypothetical protein
VGRFFLLLSTLMPGGYHGKPTENMVAQYLVDAPSLRLPHWEQIVALSSDPASSSFFFAQQLDCQMDRFRLHGLFLRL